jgi:hypothetical protein
MREEGVIECVLHAKLKLSHGYRGKKRRLKGATLSKEKVPTKVVNEKMRSQIILLVNIVERQIIPTWKRPNVRYNNCNQLGHIANFARTKSSLTLRLKWLANKKMRRNCYLQQLVFPLATIGVLAD